MEQPLHRPAASHLFDVNEIAETLPNYFADLHHHNSAKLIFLCKRARPDLQTAVSFLCTRVKKPDVDDYKKLCLTMRYLQGSLHVPLTLEAENVQIIKWWVDASYASFAVHPNMKSHTGGAMSLDRGMI